MFTGHKMSYGLGAKPTVSGYQQKRKRVKNKHPPATWLYILIGTFITRLTLFALLRPEEEDPALHVPTTSSYEKANDLPRNVGGRLSGSVIEYVSKQKRSYWYWAGGCKKREFRKTHNSVILQAGERDLQPTSLVGLGTLVKGRLG